MKIYSNQQPNLYSKLFFIELILFVIFSVTLLILGSGAIGLLGVAIICFFGISSLVKTVNRILFLIPSLLFIWFGSILVLNDLYSPYVSFLNDPTKAIFNPLSSPIIGLALISAGIFGVYFVIAKKNSNPKFKKINTVVIVVSIFSALFGCVLTYQNIFATKQIDSKSVVIDKYWKTYHNNSYEYRSNPGVFDYLINFYYLDLNIDGQIQKSIIVSKQIYSIFNPGDKVEIKYKGGQLETIKLVN
jgi:hypothetical protein